MSDAKTKVICGITWVQYNDGAWRSHKPSRWLDRYGSDWECSHAVEIAGNCVWISCRGKTSRAAILKLLDTEKRLVKELLGE